MSHQYDPHDLDSAFRNHPWRLAFRLWLLLRIVMLFAILGWWEHKSPFKLSEQALAQREKRAAERFRQALIDLGPTFIKIGQLLSTRPDILPLGFIHELESLQDRVPPFDSAIALATLKGELGQEATELFAEFDVRPLSAASIGQVHRAKLPTGEEVVVKIQRPHLETTIRLDLAILRRIASWAQGRDVTRFGVPVARDMPYVAIVDRFAQSLYDQIDFVREAENLETFRRNFADFPGVSAPKPFWEFTTTRVLTEEYVPGFKFDDYPGMAAAGLDYVAIANKGVRSFIKQVLEDGWFHADTHPGNVLVRPDGEVVYIDFGMVDTVSEESQRLMVDLFVHLVHTNFEGFIEDLIALDFLPEDVDRARVLPLVRDIYTAQLGLTERTMSLSEILEKLGSVLYDYPFYLPERFAFLMRSVGSMEGVVLSHVPTYKFLEVGLPYAGKLMLNPRKRVLRDKLVVELMPDGTLHLDRLLELYEYASREPTFHVGELVPSALDYLLSDEATAFRTALTEALLTPERQVETGPFARILARILADPSIDWLSALRQGDAFLRTVDGQEWLERVAGRLAGLEASAVIGTALPVLLPRLGSAAIAQGLATATVVLANRDLHLQGLIDWAARWLAEPESRVVLAQLGEELSALPGDRRQDLLVVAQLAIEHPRLDWTPLMAELVPYMTSPEGEVWRELVIGFLGSGEVDQALWQLGSRAWWNPSLRDGVLAGVVPALRFLLSPSAQQTRSELADAAWRRLTRLLPPL